MKKQKTKDGLTIRVLTTRDANAYFQIAREDEELKCYASFFVVNSIEEAQKKIVSYTSNYETVYGLFSKSNRLVAVFDVNDDISKDGTVNSAIVHYFVGRKYRGNNYACRGIKKLAVELAHEYIKFKFEVCNSNHASLEVQSQLGSTIDKTYTSKEYQLFEFNLAYA